MGELARALGQGSSLDFQGKTYPLSPLTFEIQGAFEIWLENRAWATYKRSARALGPDEQRALRSEIAQDIAACVYSFGSQACAKALQTPPGQKYLLFLLLKKAQTPDGPEVTEILVDKIWEGDLQEAMARVDAMINDPNSPTPAEGRDSASQTVAPS